MRMGSDPGEEDDPFTTWQTDPKSQSLTLRECGITKRPVAKTPGSSSEGLCDLETVPLPLSDHPRAAKVLLLGDFPLLPY